MEAQEYLQYGDGGLPTQYFVDGNGRLFMVLGSRRLFVLVEEKLPSPPAPLPKGEGG